MGKFINPFSDWGFKMLFGQEINKDLLISFLNDLLEGEHHIADITFKDKEQLPDTETMRGIIYDIYCVTDQGERFIVEMQNRYQEHFVDRSLYYISRAIVQQGVKGCWDYKLLPVYTVCFMNFNLTNFTPQKFRTDIALMDMKEKKVFSDNVRLIYLMLPLFQKEEDECETNFERWIYILKHMSTFERMPFLARNAVFKKLADIADVSALSREEREKYDESIKAMRDYIAVMNGAKIEGHREGFNEGRVEGRAEGRDERSLEIAKMMLEAGETIEKIKMFTGLSEQAIMDCRQ